MGAEALVRLDALLQKFLDFWTQTSRSRSKVCSISSYRASQSPSAWEIDPFVQNAVLQVRAFFLSQCWLYSSSQTGLSVSACHLHHGLDPIHPRLLELGVLHSES